MHNIKQKISVIHVELYYHVSWMGDDFHALAAAAVHNHILYNKVPAKVHLCAFIEAVIKNTRSVFFFLVYFNFNKCQAIKLKIWQNVNDTSTNTTKKEELKSAERERHTVTSPKTFWSRWYWKQMKRLSYRLRCGNIYGNFRTRSTIFGNVRAIPGASGAGNRKRYYSSFESQRSITSKQLNERTHSVRAH